MCFKIADLFINTSFFSFTGFNHENCIDKCLWQNGFTFEFSFIQYLLDGSPSSLCNLFICSMEGELICAVIRWHCAEGGNCHRLWIFPPCLSSIIFVQDVPSCPMYINAEGGTLLIEAEIVPYL